TGSLAQIYAHFPGDDVRQRGLAEPRRTEQQDMVQCLRAIPRSLDENLQLAANGLLANILVELLGTQSALKRFLPRRDGDGPDQTVGFDHPLVPRCSRLWDISRDRS